MVILDRPTETAFLVSGTCLGQTCVFSSVGLFLVLWCRVWFYSSLTWRSTKQATWSQLGGLANEAKCVYKCWIIPAYMPYKLYIYITTSPDVHLQPQSLYPLVGKMRYIRMRFCLLAAGQKFTLSVTYSTVNAGLCERSTGEKRAQPCM